jgi:crotonobetainyl-CoA:carnitine CoA-transferase CaiB-like acyl-CoA transferase
VIKLESPAGDRTRSWAPTLPDGRGLPYAVLNAGKHIVEADPESESGRQAARDLIGGADVLIAGADEVAWPMPENPVLIQCRLSAFGPRGPWSSRPGSELAVQLYSEATQSLGVPGEPPTRIGTDVASLYAGMFASHAIAALVLARLRTGIGGRVDVSVLGSAIAMRSTLWGAMSNPDEWYGLHLDGYTKPPFGGYQCEDALLQMSIGGFSPVDWNSVIEEFALSEFADRETLALLPEGTGPIARYGDVVYPIWAQALANLTMAEVNEKLARVGGRAVRINSYFDAMKEQQSAHLGLFTDRDGYVVVSPPWHFHSQANGRGTP